MTLTSLPSVSRAGSVVPASLIVSIPPMSVASTATTLGYSNSVAIPHTSLAALMMSDEHEAASAKPKKAMITSLPIADTIWRYKYINLAKLLPVRLGAPEPTLLLELFSGHQKKQPIAKKRLMTIEEWVMYFNAYIAVVAK